MLTLLTASEFTAIGLVAMTVAVDFKVTSWVCGGDWSQISFWLCARGSFNLCALTVSEWVLDLQYDCCGSVNFTL